MHFLPMPVETTNDLFCHNKKVFMLWFMSLMQCHYSVAALTVEKKLFIVTDRASDWGLKSYSKNGDKNSVC